MSEPSETSGRPLPPTTQQSSEGTTQQSSIRRKRRRDSHSSDERIGGTKSTSRRRPGTRKEAFGPHTGSSRDHSATMQRSTSPMHVQQEQPVNYTRTGRISKAKKGLKVHNCESCGRSYTRAEHLRRHQKNHNPDSDALVCDFPGCGKTFFRIDLLQRHQERHAEGKDDVELGDHPVTTAPSDVSISVPVSTISMDMSPSITRTALSHTPYFAHAIMSPVTEPPSDPRYKATQFRTPEVPSSTFGTFLHPSLNPNVSKTNRTRQPAQAPMVSIPVNGVPHHPFQDHSDPWSPQNYSSSSDYPSPIPGPDYPFFSTNPTYGAGSNRTRTSSVASIDPWTSYASRSPTSATSLPFSYPATEKSNQLGLSISMSNSPYTMSIPMSAPADPMSGYMFPGPKTYAQRDEEEQLMLFPEQYSGMGTNTYQFEQYLDNYWRLFHPSFPVIHRATLGGVNESPMLRAAMIAIGAQYSNDFDGKAKARSLHDKCMKLLDTRDLELMTEPPRLCDFQTLFLLEVLSQYRSRRAASKLTKRFEDMYQAFAQDNRIVAPPTLENLASVPPNSNEHSVYEQWCQWIKLSSRQRLLLSCYILETQQTTLLARTPQPSLIQVHGFDLPFPASIILWDAGTATEWAMTLPQYAHTPSYVSDVNPDLDMVHSLPPLDVFQSSLLIATHYHHFNTSTPHLTAPLPSVDHLLDPSPLTKHHLLTAQLIQHIPVRALLAVAGESWILSEKVPSTQGFNGFKATLRSWVNELWQSESDGRAKPIKEALKVAIDLLHHTMTTQAHALRLDMGSDMGLHYAALVIWAVTVAANTRLNPPQPQVPRFPTPIQTHHPARSHSGSYSTTPQPISASPFATPPPFATAQPPQTSNPTQMTSPSSPVPTSMLHSEITMTSLSFLSLASVEIEQLGMVPQWPHDVAQWQQGSSALLRWVKMKLRNGALDGRDSVISAGPTSVSNGRVTEELGELLNGVVGVLEKVLNRGWENWGV